jgi:hypothetical protein
MAIQKRIMYVVIRYYSFITYHIFYHEHVQDIEELKEALRIAISIPTPHTTTAAAAPAPAPASTLISRSSNGGTTCSAEDMARLRAEIQQLRVFFASF